MNCSAPFPKNDPMLPAQDATHGHCLECDSEHRLDIGCPDAVQVEWWLAVIGIVAGVLTVVLALRGAVGS